MLSVPVSLQDITHLDLVDTAAAVTIISDSIFREPKPPYLEKVVLHIAYSFPVCSVFFLISVDDIGSMSSLFQLTAPGNAVIQ